MPLITSNPINILSAGFFEYTFIDHLFFIGPIAIATIASSMLLIFLFFRKKIPKKYDLKLADTLYLGSVPISPNLLRLSLITLVAIDVGYIIASMSRIPVSLVICTGSIFLLSVYLASLNGEIIRGERKGLKGLEHDINWDIFLFMLSIFLVVQRLTNGGVVDLLASTFLATTTLPSFLSILAPSLIITIGSSFMNNWPMTILAYFLWGMQQPHYGC
jgi:arsenical pump membrane protein